MKNNENLSKIKQQYIKYSINHYKYLVNNKRKSNNALKKLIELYKKIRNGYISKDFLIDLLDFKNPMVDIIVSTHLLGLNYKTSIAIEKLKQLEMIDYDNSIWYLKTCARTTLQIYKKQGFIDIG